MPGAFYVSPVRTDVKLLRPILVLTFVYTLDRLILRSECFSHHLKYIKLVSGSARLLLASTRS